MKEFEKQIESEDNEKVQKNEKDRQTAEDLRQQSLETFAETKRGNKKMETVMMMHQRKAKSSKFRIRHSCVFA